MFPTWLQPADKSRGEIEKGAKEAGHGPGSAGGSRPARGTDTSRNGRRHEYFIVADIGPNSFARQREFVRDTSIAYGSAHRDSLESELARWNIN